MPWTLSADSPPATKPQRIATGTIAADEIVYDLLRETDQLKRLIAVSTLWGHPKYSHFKDLPAHIQGRVGNSVEGLLALKPDLVLLASYNQPDFIRQIQQANVEVAIQNRFRSVQDIYQNIGEIGKLIGLPQAAAQMTKTMKSRLTSLANKPLRDGQGQKLTYLNYSPYGTFLGAETSFHSLITSLDGINLTAKQGLSGWVKISDEILVTLDPDFIIASIGPDGEEPVRQHLNASIWQHLPAVQQDRILLIPEKDLLSVSHRFADTAEQIHSKVKRRLKAQNGSAKTTTNTGSISSGTHSKSQ
jgi:iron complex transport system substrate-binding protein